MGSASIFLIAIGLSMDAFAVSITSGIKTQKKLLQQALIIALFFGAFQALMPAIGWLAGVGLRGAITRYDHWIAFGLLSVLGGRMIWCSIVPSAENEDPETRRKHLTLRVLLTLSVATSIDALVVGFGLSVLKIGILITLAIIGTVTFLISLAGVFLGHRFGQLFGNKTECLGGLILITIGIKMLTDHLGLLPPGGFLGF